MNLRIRRQNDVPLRPGAYVLYWMTSARRPFYNHALERAVELSKQLGVPLLVLEALRIDYPWASTRFHSFILDGMRDNAAAFSEKGVRYVAFVEPAAGAGKGLLRALSANASAVVTDDFPSFFLPTMLKAAIRDLSNVYFETVDSNGLYPMRATDRVFHRAADFRRHLHKSLIPHLSVRPKADPLQDYDVGFAAIPEGVLTDFQFVTESQLTGGSVLESLPLSKAIAPADLKGGALRARARLREFCRFGLNRYAEERSDPDAHAASGLSPYLHFGHISAFEIFDAVVGCGAVVGRIGIADVGSRAGWGQSETINSFLDEFITWREIGYNFCQHRSDYAEYDSLPDWARKTLQEHASDPRPYVYSLERLAAAQTHDPVWNAAQRQLRESGVMQNYLRMLWGKKILEWSASPQEALHAMLELNNRYALDGRNPNSYSGIFWVLGRYDRAWGPERSIFGKIRYMSSDNTVRKLSMERYLETWGTSSSQLSIL